jgi:serine/threonine-protein kinase
VNTIVAMAAPRLLAGRYVYLSPVRGTQRTIIWVARDQETRTSVVASVLTPSRVAGLEPAIGVAHPHATAVLAVVDRFQPDEVPSEEPPAADSEIVIAEYVEGRSLQQRLDAGPVALESAVEWTTSIADALATLHAHGAVHGALSPRSLLVIRPEPAVIPMLTHLLVPPSGAYCSPERVTGDGPSKADDLWALAATLYTALARRPPFTGGSRTELARAIVAASPRPLDDVDLDLWAIVARALSPDAHARFESAGAFGDALRDWTAMTGRLSVGDFAPVEAMVGMTEEPPNVGDLSLVAALARPDSAEAMAPLQAPGPTFRPSFDPDSHEGRPDLAPEGSAPTTLVSGSAPAQSPISTTAVVASPSPGTTGGRRRSVVVVAAVTAAAAASAALFVYATRNRPAVTAAVSPRATAQPSSAGTPATTAPSTTEATAGGGEPAIIALGAPSAAAPSDVNACAKATLPEGTAGDSPDVGGLCTDTDLWGLTRKVNQQVLHHGTGPGLVLWAHLGRFDLAAVGLLRRRCCPNANAVTAATPKGLCESLTSSIEAVSSDPSTPNVDRYAADVDCVVSHGVRYPSEWWDRLTAKEARGYFEQFVGELRTPAR